MATTLTGVDKSIDLMKYILSIAALIFLFTFMACKDDEVPPAIISFEDTSTIMAETAGQATIQLVLDKPAPGNIIVNYTISGSATAGEDFEAPGSVEIAAGASTAELIITIIDDQVFEFDPEITNVFGESVVITLSGVTGNGKLSETAEAITHTLIIADNEQVANSITIELSWNAGDGTAGDVDMDLLLFLIDPDDGPLLIGASQQIGTDFEGIVVGTPAPDAVYGLAYRYFEGTSDNLEFKVKFIAGLGILPDGAATREYTGVYTLANVNGDVSDGATVQIVQSFEKQGANYSSFSEIEIPESGSRAVRSTGPVKGKGFGVPRIVN